MLVALWASEYAVDCALHESGLGTGERASGGRMSKEESNYGREERRKSATDRFFVVAASSSSSFSVVVAVRLGKANRARSLSPSLSSLSFPRGNFSAIRKLHSTNRDERADDVVHLVQRRRRKRLLGKIETRGHKLRAGMEHTRKKEREDRERERESYFKAGEAIERQRQFRPTFPGCRTFSLVKTFQAPLATSPPSSSSSSPSSSSQSHTSSKRPSHPRVHPR